MFIFILITEQRYGHSRIFEKANMKYHCEVFVIMAAAYPVIWTCHNSSISLLLVIDVKTFF